MVFNSIRTNRKMQTLRHVISKCCPKFAFHFPETVNYHKLRRGKLYQIVTYIRHIYQKLYTQIFEYFHSKFLRSSNKTAVNSQFSGFYLDFGLQCTLANLIKKCDLSYKIHLNSGIECTKNELAKVAMQYEKIEKTTKTKEEISSCSTRCVFSEK